MLEYVVLFVAAILIGIVGVVLGGALFLSIPLWQFMFPTLSYGNVIGNVKLGSFFRGVASTFSTWKEIAFKELFYFVLSFSLAAGIGVLITVNLSQVYLFAAVILAIAFSELAPRLTKLINKRTRYFFIVFSGIYAGVIGAGISLILVGLLRTYYPKEEQIAFVKIQARFIETISLIVVVLAHWYYGNLILALWLTWAVGMMIGGYIGGEILKKFEHFSAKWQHFYLYLVYLVALLPFLIKLF